MTNLDLGITHQLRNEQIVFVRGCDPICGRRVTQESIHNPWIDIKSSKFQQNVFQQDITVLGAFINDD